MHEIIICADDYGLTSSVNRAIEACIKAGAVKSTCVMPNMRFAHEAKHLVGTAPDNAVGIHWTLTLGRPALPAEQVPSLVDQEGCFLSFGDFRRRLKRGEISFSELTQELCCQLDRMKEITGQIDFWNTHQNVHLWPRLYQLFVELALQAGIKRMRNNSRITLAPNRTLHGLKNCRYILKGIILDWWAASARKKGMAMPDGLILMAGAGAGKMRLEEYLTRYNHFKKGLIMEATLHPAADDECGKEPLYGRLVESRYKEYKTFSDSNLKSRLLAIGFQCISFRHLNG